MTPRERAAAHNARWLLNPDRGWRNGRFRRAWWVRDTLAELVNVARGRRWYL